MVVDAEPTARRSQTVDRERHSSVSRNQVLEHPRLSERIPRDNHCSHLVDSRMRAEKSCRFRQHDLGDRLVDIRRPEIRQMERS
jgi:hypothetical protein